MPLRRGHGVGFGAGRAFAVLPLLVFAATASPAQDESATGPATQIRSNVALGKSRSEKMYLELDMEPRWQVSEGEQWRDVDLRPWSSTKRGGVE